MTMKTHNGGQLVTCLVECAPTLDFLFEDFVRRLAMRTRKSPTKTRVRLAKRTTCDIFDGLRCYL
jgi:hypothetical protein